MELGLLTYTAKNKSGDTRQRLLKALKIPKPDLVTLSSLVKCLQSGKLSNTRTSTKFSSISTLLRDLEDKIPILSKMSKVTRSVSRN